MSVARQLYQLQILDSERDHCRHRLAEVMQSLGPSDEVLQARQAVADATQGLQKAGASVRALELDISSLEAKLKANQDRLYGGKVRNPKELGGLEEEAKALRRRRTELEDQQLELMIQIEAQEAGLSDGKARLRQSENTWQEQQAYLQTERRLLEQRLAELDELCADQRAPIARVELVVYDDLRERLGGVAVALLKRDICQACGVNVPTEVSLSVQRGEGLQSCPICDRLLYGGG
jgi:predicted  nucleic acid-binding Zn-ribbon protein